MSATEQVAKLEALLARVNGRRSAPRAAVTQDDVSAPAEAAPAAVASPSKVADSAAKTPAPAPVAAAPVAAAPVVASRAPAPPPAPAPVVAAPAKPVPAPAAVTPAPVTPAPAPVAAKAAPASEPADVEVMVEEGVAEVDLDGLDEEEAAVSLRDSVADLDAAAGGSSDEPAVSSRRPIPLQPAAHALADAAEAKAPHTPPPESGRQVAIPPAAEADDELLKSGVRVAPPAPEPVAAADLKPDVTRPAIPVISPAAFHGAIPAPPPATFGELLSSTLSL